MARPPLRYPEVSRWDLPGYYRTLKSALMRLENAWEEGDLDDALADPVLPGTVGDAVHDAYSRLRDTEQPHRLRFRRASVHAIFEPLKELLSEPAHSFTARAVDEPASGRDLAAPAGDEAGGQDRIHAIEAGGRRLRLHQVVAARFWGIGFEFPDPAQDTWYANLLVRLALRRLAADLNGLLAIEAWIAARPRIADAPRIVPDAEGRGFEQLMLDILNHEEFIARRAPLVEDFLEKTDLRVHPLGLRRRRGARVQVTLTSDPLFLRRKLARIIHAEEFVVLSPRTVAEALSGPEGEELLDRGELQALWKALPRVPATIDELVMSIKASLRESCRRVGDHPRGPAATVPEPLAVLLRRYVIREAHRTTEAVRRRHRRHKPGSPSPRGRRAPPLNQIRR